MPRLFDNWPDPYERWFQTPIGALVKTVELDLVLKLLKPRPGEQILDAGCGSGLFTAPLLERGSRVTGLDLSLPMLQRARTRMSSQSFLTADMSALPFTDGTFDKVVSITALEFIENGKQALTELFRVTRPGHVARRGLRMRGARSLVTPGSVAQRSYWVWFLYRGRLTLQYILPRIAIPTWLSRSSNKVKRRR